MISSGQTDSQVNASQHTSLQNQNFVWTCEGWPNGFASRLTSQKNDKFHAYHWLMRFYNNRLLAINLCRLALGGQMARNLHLLVSKFELDQSPRKSTQVVACPFKSMQVGGQMKYKLNVSQTCIDWLASLFGQGFRKYVLLLSSFVFCYIVRIGSDIGYSVRSAQKCSFLV